MKIEFILIAVIGSLFFLIVVGSLCMYICSSKLDTNQYKHPSDENLNTEEQNDRDRKHDRSSEESLESLEYEHSLTFDKSRTVERPASKSLRFEQIEEADEEPELATWMTSSSTTSSKASSTNTASYMQQSTPPAPDVVSIQAQPSHGGLSRTTYAKAQVPQKLMATTVGFRLIHDEISSTLICQVVSVGNLLLQRYGGPARIRFEVGISSSLRKFKTLKARSELFALEKLERQPFQFGGRITWDELTILMLNLRLYGRYKIGTRKSSKDKLVGSLKVELSSIDFRNGEANFVRPILPKSSR